MNHFGYSSQDQCIETNTKRILTLVLKCRNENIYSAHPSTCTFTPDETVSLKIYSIELKYYSWSLFMHVMYSQSDALYIPNQMHIMLL